MYPDPLPHNASPKEEREWDEAYSQAECDRLAKEEVEAVEFMPVAPVPGDLVASPMGGMYVEDDSAFTARMRQRDREYLQEPLGGWDRPR